MSVSIKYKGNEIAKMTASGTKTLNTEGKYCEGNIIVENTESGGGGAVSPKDINFYDYDGTLVAAWELSELAGKTSLPDYPTHEGLTCQGWNWTLADLKAENAKMNVGAMYITSDGKTRIYITLQEGRTSPMLGICPNGTVTVDWGDGTTPDTLTGTSVNTVQWTPTHNYAAPGDYVIVLTVEGTCRFGGDTNGSYLLCYSSNRTDKRNLVYLNAIQRIEVGNSITGISDYAFNICYNLASITLPSGITSIGNSAFQSCYNLAQITLPSGITSIGNNAFQTCRSLASITLPSGITSIGNSAFQYCSSLASITLPSGITSIGNNAFRSCYSLTQITLPSGITSIGDNMFQSCYNLAQITLPSGITSIGNSAFQYCNCLASITLPSGITSIGNSAFQYCSSLASITLPSGITSIGNSAFQYCNCLASITLPSGITSIGNNAFQTCSSLASITLPSSITSIQPMAFIYCYGMAFYDFTACTAVPTLSNANAFTDIPADCKIRVPAALLDEWKAATNWATYANQIVGV